MATTTRRTGNLKVWAELVVVAGVSAAIAVGVMGATLDAGPAVAATATDATIEATPFTVQSVSVEEGQIGEAFAVCPGTKRALGGGVVHSGLFGSTVIASGPLDSTGVTLETRDGDKAKQWYAAVYNNTGGTRTYKVFAICSGTSDATIEATQFTVGSRQTGEAFAVCPGTKRAVGGGVIQSGLAEDSIWVDASGPLDSTGVTSQTITGDIAKQWYAAVDNNGAERRTFKVFAICSGTSTARIKASAFSVDGFNQVNEAFAKCGTTKRALGGGVVQSGPATSFLRVVASGPLDSTGVTLETNDGDRAKQWYAAVHNSTGELRELKVFAICE